MYGVRSTEYIGGQWIEGMVGSGGRLHPRTGPYPPESHLHANHALVNMQVHRLPRPNQQDLSPPHLLIVYLQYTNHSFFSLSSRSFRPFFLIYLPFHLA